jgi:hypothetical protein
MGMDVGDMDGALAHDIDPKTVEGKLATAQHELKLARKARDMFGDRPFQIGENAGALRQVVQRSVGV